MVYLSRKMTSRELIVEETNHDYTTQPPLFYLRHWTSPLELHSGDYHGYAQSKNGSPDTGAPTELRGL